MSLMFSHRSEEEPPPDKQGEGIADRVAPGYPSGTPSDERTRDDPRYQEASDEQPSAEKRLGGCERSKSARESERRTTERYTDGNRKKQLAS